MYSFIELSTLSLSLHIIWLHLSCAKAPSCLNTLCVRRKPMLWAVDSLYKSCQFSFFSKSGIGKRSQSPLVAFNIEIGATPAINL